MCSEMGYVFRLASIALMEHLMGVGLAPTRLDFVKLSDFVRGCGLAGSFCETVAVIVTDARFARAVREDPPFQSLAGCS